MPIFFHFYQLGWETGDGEGGCWEVVLEHQLFMEAEGGYTNTAASFTPSSEVYCLN